MLGKLIKNEFKATYKTLLVIYIITIITTLGFCFFGIRQFTSYSFHPSANEILQRIQHILGVTFTIAYVIIVIALTLLTYILMCERFYKSMYSEQGYLTHTLPVNPLSNLNARLITSLVWLLISGIILILSILAIEAAAEPQDFFDFLRSLRYSDIDRDILFATGYHFPVFALIILLLVLMAFANALLLIFAALSLGQLASLHKIRAAIGCGIGLGILEQTVFTSITIHIVNTIAITAVDSSVKSAGYLTQRMQNSFQITIWSTIGIFAVFAASYYAICAFIVKKHVNLE